MRAAWNLKAHGLLTAAALLWAGNFVTGRWIRDDIDPLTLNTLRWIVAFVVLTPLVARRLRLAMPHLRASFGLHLFLGVTGVTLFNYCAYRALSLTPVANALLILATLPLVLLLTSAALGRTRIGWIDAAALTLSGAGIMTLLSGGAPTSLAAIRPTLGDAWMFVAVASWVGYTLALRRRPASLDPLASLWWSVALGLVVLLAAAIGTGGIGIEPQASSVAAILYVGIGASVMAYLAWNAGVARLGAEAAGYYINAMPFFGAGLAWLMLGETIGPPETLAGGLILAAIVVAARRDPAKARSDARGRPLEKLDAARTGRSADAPRT